MTQISWGTKIAMLYISFVLLILFMVVLSMNQKIELVSKDYYAQELVYQNKIDDMNNANALSKNIENTFTSDGLLLTFPEEFKSLNVSGSILFFRPSDASKDYKTTIQLNENLQQSISKDNLSSGMYKMQVSWTANNKNYFTEKIIVLP